MNPSNPWFLAAFVGVVILYHLDLGISLLNLAQFGKPLPETLRPLYDQDTLERCQDYHRQSTQLDLAQETAQLAVLLTFWLAGGFGWLHAWTTSLGWHPVATGTLAISLTTAASSFLALPFTLWQTFKIEAAFGFNRTSLLTFILDQFKALVLLATLGLPLLALILWLFETLTWAPFAAWATLALFSLLMTWISPRFIMPLFLHFDPLPAGPLRDAILALSRRLDFPVADVSIVDGSRRSSKANAFFAGFGKSKRIALYDTLIASHSQDELLAVLSHEIGHSKRGHVTRHLTVALIESALLFTGLHFALQSPAFFAAFGIQGTPVGLGLAVFSILYKPFSLLLSLPGMWLSRVHEFEADAFARSAMGSPKPLETALKKLSTDQLAHPSPHPLAVRLHYSHPPLLQRLTALESKAV
jgi:STE24 endopeptidase